MTNGISAGMAGGMTLSVALEIPERQVAIRFGAEPGELIRLAGPSGSGKTTVLHALAGLVTPAHGRIVYVDKTWFDGRTGESLAPEHRAIALAFQEPRLFPHLTAFGNVAYGLSAKLTKANTAMHVERALLAANALDLRHKMPSELSGGQAQRVALARAIARPMAQIGQTTNAPLMLLDEPFSALDDATAAATWQSLHAVCSSLGATVIVASHESRLFHAARIVSLLEKSD